MYRLGNTLNSYFCFSFTYPFGILLNLFQTVGIGMSACGCELRQQNVYNLTEYFFAFYPAWKITYCKAYYVIHFNKRYISSIPSNQAVQTRYACCFLYCSHSNHQLTIDYKCLETLISFCRAASFTYKRKQNKRPILAFC